jgi:hypothetical protein
MKNLKSFLIQAALDIRGFGIRGFDYSGTNNANNQGKLTNLA